MYNITTIQDVVEFVRKDAEVGVRFFDNSADQRVIKRNCATREEARKVAEEAVMDLQKLVDSTIRDWLERLPKAKP